VTILERIKRKIKVNEETGCWEWQGCRTSKGYGWMHADGGRNHSDGVHRLMWRQLNGKVPNGLQVLHRCDNRACCNPDHLCVGTPEDNSVDMVKKGRSAKGEQHSQRKLTETQVREIRALYKTKSVTLAEIGMQFGIGAPAVHAIVNRRLWKHVS